MWAGLPVVLLDRRCAAAKLDPLNRTQERGALDNDVLLGDVVIGMQLIENDLPEPIVDGTARLK